MEPELRIMFHVLLLSICFVCGLIVSFHKDGKLSTLQLGPYLTIIFKNSLGFFIMFEILFWMLWATFVSDHVYWCWIC